MTFAAIPSGTRVFLDANTLIYHFSGDPLYGAACTQLVKRVEFRDIDGFISTHELTDVAHRLMTLEAMNIHGWPAAGVAARLRKNRTEISKLTVYRNAVASSRLLGIQVLDVTHTSVDSAMALAGQFQLLTGDSLIVAVMQQHGIVDIASNDADFDHVTGIGRWTPI